MDHSLSKTTRRSFVAASTMAGIVSAVPSLAQAKTADQVPQLKLGPGGEILDVSENRAALVETERAKPLTPEQLLRLATLYRDYPANLPLSQHLAELAISMFVSSPAVNRAMLTIAKTQVEWSWLGDVYHAVRDFFTHTGGSGCEIKCILGSVLVEKCPGKKYHVIGVCFGGSF
jgi:hypothetical protein